MTLLDSVSVYLTERAIPHAIIGAAALAFHGVSRSTFDQDFLVTDQRVLDTPFWQQFDSNTSVDQRRGDSDDPLAGVVRIQRSGERDVDLVVGRHQWQEELLARADALPASMGLKVVGKAGLVLLKLYAGGSQDRWDISQLLATDDTGTLSNEVSRVLPALPTRCTELWLDILKTN